MDISIVYGIMGILGVVGLSLSGVPIAVSLGAVGLLGLYYVAGPNMAFVTLRTLPYDLGSSYTLVVVPMFILMGLVGSAAGIMTDLFDAFNRWLSRFRGSLLLVTTVASAAFGAVSGSTIVNASVFTRIALADMIRLGYKPGPAAATIASAGTLASLIPPSLNLVLIALLTDLSIGKLLLAGLVPGIVTTLMYMLTIIVCVRIFKDWAPQLTNHYSWKEKFSSLRRIWPVVILSTIVVGGIYTGITPPSAAGGVGAVGVIMIVAIQRRLTLEMLWASLKQTVQISAMLFVIIMGGLLFSRFLTVSGVIDNIVLAFNQAGMGKYSFLLMVMGLFLILGMFMDTMSIVVITTPLFYPLVQALGINPIWYSIIIVKLMEISCISPPVGMNLFAVLAAADQSVKVLDLYKGVIPFIIFDLITIGILFLFPAIVTWLPDTMF